MPVMPLGCYREWWPTTHSGLELVEQDMLRESADPAKGLTLAPRRCRVGLSCRSPWIEFVAPRTVACAR
eukprot:745810-Alexandrium_andersonii.AAC.1